MPRWSLFWVLMFLVLLAPISGLAKQKDPPLHKAVKAGSVEGVRAKILAGEDLSRRDEYNGYTALHLALSLGQREIALELIQRGADINARTPFAESPLILAIDKGYQDVIDILLTRNAKPAFHAPGPSALATAARKGDAQTVERLLTAGAPVNHQRLSGLTALHLAANFGHDNLVERLLVAGADINAVTPDGRTPAHFALQNQKFATATLLVKKGAAVSPASGELGEHATALLYRLAAQVSYDAGALEQAQNYLKLAKPVFESVKANAAVRADEFAGKVNKTRLLNVLSFAVAQTSANVQAQTSLSGSGVAGYTTRSPATDKQARDSYRGLILWIDNELKREDLVLQCLSSAGAGGDCFNKHPAK